MATAKIEAAISSIPKKKESLRKSLETLSSYSSSLASFTLQWKDLEDHFSYIEKSIDERFKALLAKEKDSPLPNEVELSASSEREKISALCTRMEEDLPGALDGLGAVLKATPEAALLVIEAVSKPSLTKRQCIHLLEKMQEVGPAVGPEVREKALKLAGEWRGKIPDKGDNTLDVIGFLQLIASYNLVSVFDREDILELYSLVSRRKHANNLVKNLGLTENLHELVEKLSSKGRQIDAVRLVYTYNAVDKFPPVPLLLAYIKDVKKGAQEIQKKGQNSRQALNEAASKEMGALKSVLKMVDDYKIEDYPREGLQKRIDRLEKDKAKKKRNAAVSGSSSQKNQYYQQPNKRSRPSETTSTHSRPADAYNPIINQTYHQPQLGRADHASYMAGPYSLAAPGSVYGHAAPSHPAPGSVYSQTTQSIPPTTMGHSGAVSPRRSYFYQPEAYAGSSGLHERPGAYSFAPTLPPTYPELYP